jgi:tetratricopeptide (TPR) repeat protein
MPEYAAALWDSAFLELLRLLSQAGKGADAVAAADGWLREHPGKGRNSMSFAVQMAKAEGLAAAGDKVRAIALAQVVAGADPNGPAGTAARDRIREWAQGVDVNAGQMLLIADGLMDRESYREALIDLRRAVELCRDASELAKHEPVAAFKRGDCFRALKQDVEASLAFQDVFRKYRARPSRRCAR